MKGYHLILALVMSAGIARCQLALNDVVFHECLRNGGNAKEANSDKYSVLRPGVGSIPIVWASAPMPSDSRAFVVDWRDGSLIYFTDNGSTVEARRASLVLGGGSFAVSATLLSTLAGAGGLPVAVCQRADSVFLLLVSNGNALTVHQVTVNGPSVGWSQLFTINHNTTTGVGTDISVDDYSGEIIVSMFASGVARVYTVSGGGTSHVQYSGNRPMAVERVSGFLSSGTTIMASDGAAPNGLGSYNLVVGSAGLNINGGLTWCNDVVLVSDVGTQAPASRFLLALDDNTSTATDPFGRALIQARNIQISPLSNGAGTNLLSVPGLALNRYASIDRLAPFAVGAVNPYGVPFPNDATPAQLGCSIIKPLFELSAATPPNLAFSLIVKHPSVVGSGGGGLVMGLVGVQAGVPSGLGGSYYVDPSSGSTSIVFAPLVAGTSSSVLNASIAPSVSFVGLSLFYQFLVLDNNVQPHGLRFTNGLEVRLGQF